jgi:hypothetical protein
MRPERVGPYKVLHRLGAGGMGSVYLALDDEGRALAVKVIHPHVAEDVNGLRRLAREVQAMKRVASPHVAELQDADLTGAEPYIATLYVQGRSLQQVVERHGSLTGEALWTVGAGLVDALDAIHGVDVVHRDLTPRNVMMADGAPVVIDFGIAQAFDASRITQTLIGTPGFVAPEVIRGERAAPAADVFSWGATMAFAATGRRCFAGRTIMETLHKTLETEPDLTGVPRDLAPVVWRCLRKEPSERPSTDALIGSNYTFSPGGLLPVEPRRETSASRVSALWAAAGEARRKGEVGRAEELYAEVRQIAIKARDPQSEMFALYQLGSAAEYRGEYEAAHERYAEVQHVAKSVGAATIEALALRGLERLAVVVDDPEKAHAYAEQARRVLDDRYRQVAGRQPDDAEAEPSPRAPWMPR